MATATFTSKGQLTLPIELRTKLGLHPGSLVEFVELKDSTWNLHVKSGDIRRLKGIIKCDGPPITLEQMNEAIGEAATRDYLRSIE